MDVTWLGNFLASYKVSMPRIMHSHFLGNNKGHSSKMDLINTSISCEFEIGLATWSLDPLT